jgi:hypothetical protein
MDSALISVSHSKRKTEKKCGPKRDNMLSRIYKPLSKVTLFACLLGMPAIAAQIAAEPLAQVTAISATTHVVTARDLAGGRIFEFSLQNAALLRNLRVGQGVYVNFATKQVALDGRTVVGQIIEAPVGLASPAKGSSVPPRGAPASSTPLRPAALQPTIAAKTNGTIGAQQSPGGPVTLGEPTLGSVIGEPKITLLKKQENLELRHVSANVDGQQVESDIMRLTGPEAIQSAYDQGLLPESAKDALLEHAKNLDPSHRSTSSTNRSQRHGQRRTLLCQRRPRQQRWEALAVQRTARD